MHQSRFLSFSLSLALHASIIAAAFFWPVSSTPPVDLSAPIIDIGIYTIGAPGRAPSQASSAPKAGGAAQAPARAPQPEPPSAPPSQPAPQIPKPEPKKPEPAPVKPAEPEAVPIPQPEAPKEPEKPKPEPQKTVEKPKPEPQKTVEKPKEQPKPEQKPAPKQQQQNPKQNSGDAVRNALGDMKKGSSSSSIANALGDLNKGRGGATIADALGDMKSTGSGDDATGDGPGGSGGDGVGIRGSYMQSLRSRIQANWEYGGRADRKNPTAVVEITIAKDGSITGAAIVTSSGDAAFDGSVLKAVYDTGQVEAPPTRELSKVRVSFAYEGMPR